MVSWTRTWTKTGKESSCLLELPTSKRKSPFPTGVSRRLMRGMTRLKEVVDNVSHDLRGVSVSKRTEKLVRDMLLAWLWSERSLETFSGRSLKLKATFPSSCCCVIGSLRRKADPMSLTGLHFDFLLRKKKGRYVCQEMIFIPSEIGRTSKVRKGNTRGKYKRGVKKSYKKTHN